MESATEKHSLPKRFFCWFFSRRTLRRGLFLLACLVTLLALAITEENWRGKRAWEKFKQEWESKGERFDLAGVIPPPVTDDQNFARADIFAGVFNQQPDPKTGKLKPRDPAITDRLQVSIFGPKIEAVQPVKIVQPSLGSWQKATRTDLKFWQEYYRGLASTSINANKPAAPQALEFPVPSQPGKPAADVLLALSKQAPIIEELRQAAARPASSFPLDYEDSFAAAAALLGPITKFRACSQMLALRAGAELEDGQSESALSDVKLSFRLVEALRGEPFLITHMVRLAVFQTMLNPVWEGLAGHHWTDFQLLSLIGMLQPLDFLADYERAIREERAFAVWTMDTQRHFGPLMPSGWRYQNQLSICRFHLNWLRPMVDSERRVVSPERARQITADFNASQRVTPYNLFAVSLFPALAKANQQFARAQSALHLARVGCALERYRLAHSQYPETLDALVPQFMEKLPHDIINGRPLLYRKEKDGKFVLYSVGWNETDDGGTVALTKDGTVDRDKGDWVWRQ